MISLYLTRMSDYLENLKDGFCKTIKKNTVVNVFNKEDKNVYSIFSDKIDPDKHLLVIDARGYHIWTIQR